jgi:hypothetical protein
MTDDRHGQGLHDTQAQRSTSPVAKMLGYGAIIVLLIAVVLLATGAIKFGPF